MDKEVLLKSLKELKEKYSKNFKQTVDLIYTFKGLDLKKPENHLDFTVVLNHSRGKPVKICALIGPELKETATQNCDTVILSDEFPRYAKDKKLLKKLASEHSFFIAQANIMTLVASNFGKVLGPKAKMPNPKAGCVVPPGANLKPLTEKLKNTVRIVARTAPMVQLIVGKEDMPEDQIIDNINLIDENIANHLPGGRAQIKGIYLKPITTSLKSNARQSQDGKDCIVQTLADEVTKDLNVIVSRVIQTAAGKIFTYTFHVIHKSFKFNFIKANFHKSTLIHSKKAFSKSRYG